MSNLHKSLFKKVSNTLILEINFIVVNLAFSFKLSLPIVYANDYALSLELK